MVITLFYHPERLLCEYQASKLFKGCFLLSRHINFTEIGPLTVSNDPTVCADASHSLYPHGGGDCPELAMSGIEAALQQV